MDKPAPTAEVQRLFWDVDPRTVDLLRHRDYVLDRVMSRGGWAAMCWLLQAYSREDLGDFLRRRGYRLAPRDLAYWSLIAGISVHPSAGASPGGGRPPWAGR